MAVLLRSLRALFPVLRLRPWMVLLMIILGVLTALSEGLSISLFIPLVQSQIGTESIGAIGKMTTLFKGIPAEKRLFVDRCQHSSVCGAEERAQLQLFPGLAVG